MDVMKILYVGGLSLPDGTAADQRVVGIAKGLREIGHEVIFLNEPKHSNKTDVTSYFGFKTYEYPRGLGFEFGIEHLKEMVSKEKIDAVIAYNHHSIPLGKTIKFCKKRGIKCYSDCTEWYNYLGHDPLNVIRRIDTKKRMIKLHPKMDGMIAISDYLYDYYKDKTKTVNIPPLVDITDEKWNITKPKNDVPTFVYAGSPSSQKEKLGLIVETVENIAKDTPILLKVVGITKEQFVKMYSVKYEGHSVKFFGRIPHQQAVKEVATADWSVLIRDNTLSNKAGFPTKLAESITCGTPVIANHFSNIDRYLDESNSIRIEDTSELDGAIRKAIGYKTNVDRNLFDYHNYLDALKSLLED